MKAFVIVYKCYLSIVKYSVGKCENELSNMQKRNGMGDGYITV